MPPGRRCAGKNEERFATVTSCCDLLVLESLQRDTCSQMPACARNKGKRGALFPTLGDSSRRRAVFATSLYTNLEPRGANLSVSTRASSQTVMLRSVLCLVAVACASAFVPVVPLRATAPAVTRTTDVQMIVRRSLVHRPCSVLSAVLSTSPPPSSFSESFSPLMPAFAARFLLPMPRRYLPAHPITPATPRSPCPACCSARSATETSSRSSTGLLTSARLCSAR